MNKKKSNEWCTTSHYNSIIYINQSQSKAFQSKINVALINMRHSILGLVMSLLEKEVPEPPLVWPASHLYAKIQTLYSTQTIIPCKKNSFNYVTIWLQDVFEQQNFDLIYLVIGSSPSRQERDWCNFLSMTKVNPNISTASLAVSTW